jgi:hypothetical protein
MRSRITSLSVLVFLSVCRVVFADNTTPGGAYSLTIGGTPAEATVVSGTTDRWYIIGYVIAGRSYCAETQAGVHFDTSASAGLTDSTLTVYQGNGTTVIGANDDASNTEPAAALLSRVCYVAPATDANYIKVTSLSGTFNVRVRIVETTLFSNWFYLGGDYGAFTLIRNTTSTSVGYTINWRNASGAIVATTTGTLSGNGSTFVNARNFAGAVAAGSGTVEIVHNGPPDAIMATTTVLSSTTGLSFDTYFAKRQPW